MAGAGGCCCCVWLTGLGCFSSKAGSNATSGLLALQLPHAQNAVQRTAVAAAAQASQLTGRAHPACCAGLGCAVQGGHDQHDARLQQGLPAGTGDCFALVPVAAQFALWVQAWAATPHAVAQHIHISASQCLEAPLPLCCPSQQIFALRDNYRSCARIVATAERVIAANDDWERAGLRPKRPAGHPIEVGAGRSSIPPSSHRHSNLWVLPTGACSGRSCAAQ